ncbi:uncharacterized protein LOC109814333 [Cajanus cajan]|uniref:DUF4408 domain-containing protein n=1 Tax=Cajanus cajan TaxID=3821 RepID=A0A151RZX0_CAJCA|nr:uncharacterized protein LOC109814333 [Cajanus cajan]KYP48115.1 hypothetical protein KK1_030198 [Cajanus cajan]
MDYSKHKNSNLHHSHLLSQSSKKSIKFLLCFSLFCVLFSLLPLLVQSLNPFLVQFFSYIVEKSYMFLLCNGLLVLIALNSGLTNAPSQQAIQHALAVPVERVAPPIAESPQEEENVLVVVEQEKVVSNAQEDEQEEGNAIVIIDEHEHEHGVDDAEELNKKCEDFIKRMKATFSSNNLEPRGVAGFYFENQTSWVAVN